MNKRHAFYVGIVLLAVVALFGAPLAAVAAHPPVTVLDAGGAAITNGTTPYSPKQTCGGCHFDCQTGLYSTVTTSYCLDDTARRTWFGVVTLGTGTSCNTPGKCPDYASADTKTVSKHKGYPSGGLAFASFNVTVPMHGASIGKHSGEGRNEELAAAQRTIWGAPGFISSPGMFGRY